MTIRGDNGPRRSFDADGGEDATGAASELLMTLEKEYLPPRELARTAVLLIDPYNDLLDSQGKAWPAIADVAADVGLLANLKGVVEEARTSGLCIVYLPKRSVPRNGAYLTPSQRAAADASWFVRGSWGAEWFPDLAPRAGDIIASERVAVGAFAGTDLGLQLRALDIVRLVVVGGIANEALEATARAAVDQGFHVTLVRDATAAANWDAMRATLEANAPHCAHQVIGTREFYDALACARLALRSVGR
ncbi:cysteine hydrolase family protein [Sphingomonas sp.]|uniref:cysteine hydrolase family protein n=1 Tax=Sphingomonas sp. TaxID=28214 RepID=UPI001B00137B|nr:cysteine hydrolase family protein [Sphingomonas sp.]MBO9714777.1 cysteine hydrolase family protein [Sphingomonas sp.]